MASLLVITACAGKPTIDTTAELTHDGLAPINNSNFREAWADPDIDFKQYNQIMLGAAEFEFRAVRKSSTAASIRRTGTDEFWIDDENRQRLVDTVTEVFRDELASVRDLHLPIALGQRR